MMTHVAVDSSLLTWMHSVPAEPLDSRLWSGQHSNGITEISDEMLLRCSAA